MKRLLALAQRLRAYLLGRPVILSISDTRMTLQDGRTTLAVALYGWGWVAVNTASIKPRWRDWQFFARSCARLVVPPSQQVQIVTINVFGRSAKPWHRPTNESPVPAMALVPPTRPSLSGHRPPQLCPILYQTPLWTSSPRFDHRHLRHIVPPALSVVHTAPTRVPCSAPAHSPEIWDRMTLCSQLVRNAAASAASAITRTNDEAPRNRDTNGNINNRASKWDRTN